MVARIVLGEHSRWPIRVADRGVEIEDAIVGLAGSNPLVERLALGLSLWCPVVRVLKWRERRPEDPEALRAGALNHLFVRRDEFRRAGRGALSRLPDVVDAFEDDDVRRA